MHRNLCMNLKWAKENTHLAKCGKETLNVPGKNVQNVDDSYYLSSASTFTVMFIIASLVGELCIYYPKRCIYGNVILSHSPPSHSITMRRIQQCHIIRWFSCVSHSITMQCTATTNYHQVLHILQCSTQRLHHFVPQGSSVVHISVCINN